MVHIMGAVDRVAQALALVVGIGSPKDLVVKELEFQ
jgi:hypothetical protein